LLPQLKGISARIDSCVGMIAKEAFKAHSYLAPEHKRWVDPEDMLQNALLEAVQAERRYDENSPAKYSTYLMTGLQYRLSKDVGSTKVKGRAAACIVELDAPLGDGDNRRLEVVSRAVTRDRVHERVRRGVYGLDALCSALSPATRMVVVRVLLFGKRVEGWELSGLMAEAAALVPRLGLQWADLDYLRENEKSRKMALIQLVRSGTVGLTEMTDARLLECVRCGGQFPLSAIREGRYVVSTMTCGVCYGELKAKPSHESCFGKPEASGGYGAKDVNCQIHCQDRRVCRSVVQGENIVKYADKAVEEELEDVDFDEEETPKKAKKSKTKTETEKPAKAAKAKKEDGPEEDEANGPSPKEVGPRWPWKRNSHMRNAFAFVFKYKPTKDEFIEAFKKVGGNTVLLLRLLAKGRSGKGTITHTWKLDESGGKLKVYDIKYLGEDGKPASEFAKSAKPAKAKTEAKAKKSGKAKAKAKAA
jgi:hypothetical protein